MNHFIFKSTEILNELGWYWKNHFLASITNTAVPVDISHSNPFSTKLKECFERGLSLEAGYHLSGGVNVARAANLINIQVEDGEINEVKSKDI